VRDWLVILVPLALALSFIPYPKQYSAWGDWLATFLQ
jgi:hypothetical protein